MDLTIVTVLLWVYMVSPAIARADECIQPANARVFASDSGRHIFKVDRKQSELPTARLIAIQDNFREREIWQSRLVNVPARVFVSDDGRSVVAIDNAGCRFGFDHSVVVYGDGGRVVADYALNQILSDAEVQQHVRVTMAGRHWTEKARFEFGPSGRVLVIAFAWGRQLGIDLVDGTVSAADGAARD